MATLKCFWRTRTKENTDAVDIYDHDDMNVEIGHFVVILKFELFPNSLIIRVKI